MTWNIKHSGNTSKQNDPCEHAVVLAAHLTWVFFFHDMVRTALTSVNTYQWTASLREPRPLGKLGVGSVKSVINECLCGTSHYETPEGKGWRGWRIFRFCHVKTHMIPLNTGKLSARKIKLRSQSRYRFSKWSMISRWELDFWAHFLSNRSRCVGSTLNIIAYISS